MYKESIKHMFKLKYDEEAIDDLKYIEKKYYSLIRKTIEKQLTEEPLVETKNRKPLSHSSLGDAWELRFGRNNIFRVIYKVYEENKEVLIVMIGIKEGNIFKVKGEEY